MIYQKLSVMGLSVAAIFLDTPYRRLPVLDGQRLVGQVSRRDLLQKAHDLMAVAPERPGPSLLYLSSLVDREEAPIR